MLGLDKKVVLNHGRKEREREREQQTKYEEKHEYQDQTKWIRGATQKSQTEREEKALTTLLMPVSLSAAHGLLPLH